MGCNKSNSKKALVTDVFFNKQEKSQTPKIITKIRGKKKPIVIIRKK